MYRADFNCPLFEGKNENVGVDINYSAFEEIAIEI